jgi:large subunit ribosomal protein L3e
MFEALDGLATVTSLLTRRDTPEDVRLKTVEFLYFYLMPEAPVTKPSQPATPAAPRGRTVSGSKVKEFRVDRTIEEKQKMLGQFINVEGLVRDVTENQPFGL